MNMNSIPEELKQLILISKEPLLFKNILVSDLLNWNLEDWNRVLKENELEFRSGVYEHTKDPQWESKTNLIKGSFEYFLSKTELEPKNWLYFDYKYLKDWLTGVKDLRNSITWAPLGFTDVTADDCTIWIGSKGAHTPCHVDTYGFNMIFQVFGRKLWIVAPPEENLRPTRIPYEESSIYSKLNFFSPTPADFKGVNNCRKIILNPGEVLFLPHKWWHYVENLETAISINVWIPIADDDEERFKESIVQLLVKQMVEVSSKESNNLILNPNMEQIFHNDFQSFLNILNTCKNVCNEKSTRNKRFKEGDNKIDEKSTHVNGDEIIEKYKFIERIPKMSKDELQLFLEEQDNRFKKNVADALSHQENSTLQLLNVLVDSDVVSLIGEKLLANMT